MDESALWEKIPQGKSTVPLWYTTRIFPTWETQRAEIILCGRFHRRHLWKIQVRKCTTHKFFRECVVSHTLIECVGNATRRRLSVNGQLGNSSRETRGACKQMPAAHVLLCRCTAACALGHLHSPCVEKRRHD